MNSGLGCVVLLLYNFQNKGGVFFLLLLLSTTLRSLTSRTEKSRITGIVAVRFVFVLGVLCVLCARVHVRKEKIGEQTFSFQ